MSSQSEQEIMFYTMVCEAREDPQSPEAEALLWACEELETQHQELMWVRSCYRLAEAGFKTAARLLEEKNND